MGKQPTRATTVETTAVVGLALAAALLFGRLGGMDTDYDEGVYLVSEDALRHGQELGSEVFAPQLPGWYALLRLGGLLGADSVQGFHVWMTVLAVLTCIAAYACARRLAGPVAGVVTGALLVIAPPFPLYAHRVLADVSPLGFALTALAVASPSTGRAALAGALLAAGASVKPTALLALPALVLLLQPVRRRTGLAAAGGAAAVAACFAAAHARALDNLWESVVVYHADARETPAVLDRADELVQFLDPRTPFAWLVIAGILATAIAAARRRPFPSIAVWSAPALAVVVMLWQRPLHENHLLVLPVALAVAAGTALGFSLARAGRLRTPAATLLALAIAVGYVQQHRRAAAEEVAEEPDVVWTAGRLHNAAARDDLVVSDQPIAAYLAGRRVPGELVDTAVLRFETGSLTPEEVFDVLDERDVAAVAAARSFLEHPDLIAGLARRYGHLEQRGDVRVYSDPR